MAMVRNWNSPEEEGNAVDIGASPEDHEERIDVSKVEGEDDGDQVEEDDCDDDDPVEEDDCDDDANYDGDNIAEVLNTEEFCTYDDAAADDIGNESNNHFQDLIEEVTTILIAPSNEDEAVPDEQSPDEQSPDDLCPTEGIGQPGFDDSSGMVDDCVNENNSTLEDYAEGVEFPAQRDNCNNDGGDKNDANGEEEETNIKDGEERINLSKVEGEDNGDQVKEDDCDDDQVEENDYDDDQVKEDDCDDDANHDGDDIAKVLNFEEFRTCDDAAADDIGNESNNNIQDLIEDATTIVIAHSNEDEAVPDEQSPDDLRPIEGIGQPGFDDSSAMVDDRVNENNNSTLEDRDEGEEFPAKPDDWDENGGDENVGDGEEEETNIKDGEENVNQSAEEVAGESGALFRLDCACDEDEEDEDVLDPTEELKDDECQQGDTAKDVGTQTHDDTHNDTRNATLDVTHNVVTHNVVTHNDDDDDEDEDEDLVDPREELKEKCSQNKDCKRLFKKLESCNERVEQGDLLFRGETCTEELFDFVECVDHCVAKFMHLKLV